MHDITFHALLLVMMVEELSGLIGDVETIFLHKELEEDIFMECPQGMDNQSDDEILICTSASTYLCKVQDSSTRKLLLS